MSRPYGRSKGHHADVRRPVLIGPVCAGKTTLLPLVAHRLGRPWVDLDDVAEPYYEEVGYGRDALNAVGAERGDLGAYSWWQQGHPHAVRRVLQDHPDAVIALGAGHTSYMDIALFDEVRSLLEPCATVLILPSPDSERSLRVLRERAMERNGADWIMDGVDFLEQWVSGNHNRLLATVTMYTEGRSPSDVADAIVEAIGSEPAH